MSARPLLNIPLLGFPREKIFPGISGGVYSFYHARPIKGVDVFVWQQAHQRERGVYSWGCQANAGNGTVVRRFSEAFKGVSPDRVGTVSCVLQAKALIYDWIKQYERTTSGGVGDDVA